MLVGVTSGPGLHVELVEGQRAGERQRRSAPAAPGGDDQRAGLHVELVEGQRAGLHVELVGVTSGPGCTWSWWKVSGPGCTWCWWG